MIVYICGKITGEPNYKEFFRIAEEKLIRLGHTVVNPAAINYPITATYEEIMEFDLKQLEKCEAIYRLDNWETSYGACVETVRAIKLNLFFNEFDAPSGICWIKKGE